ncbi:helix-turn-helix transcriptional regulator [Flavobacterium acetivorans]|uniref:helix-turn-helix transcriptional regulator n=1 Tax=Flavobacterium acetivorans TaxID=2893883 RepID=UPI001E44880E|nr:helix-turn-helix domain-containing protein [Flavobacterium sp. F-29]UFH36073.1 helix-turn-helix domain-containing protein [Flavobacterium sp. F-29]
MTNRQDNLSKEFLTIVEAAKYLSISESALYKKTSNKEIPYYVPGGKKIYILKGDLDNWVLSGKVNPVSEINLETERYLSRNSKIQMSC